jgi:hypothetical protein
MSAALGISDGSEAAGWNEPLGKTVRSRRGGCRRAARRRGLVCVQDCYPGSAAGNASQRELESASGGLELEKPLRRKVYLSLYW